MPIRAIRSPRHSLTVKPSTVLLLVNSAINRPPFGDLEHYDNIRQVVNSKTVVEISFGSPSPKQQIRTPPADTQVEVRFVASEAGFVLKAQKRSRKSRRCGNRIATRSATS